MNKKFVLIVTLGLSLIVEGCAVYVPHHHGWDGDHHNGHHHHGYYGRR